MILSISSTQLAIVNANPTKFIDGIVVDRRSGRVDLSLFVDNSLLRFRLFEAPIDYSSFNLGEPISYHPLAELLATCSVWIAAKCLN